MPSEIINGVNVEFPYEPYDVQRSYMSAVIAALKEKNHAVLESPTGTGKTLSLLCSSISWLKQNGFLHTGINMSNNFVTSNDVTDPFLEQNTWGGGSRMKIFYASRTHSQLSKVMTELKSTSFKDIKVTILGSRDQMCIHPTVSKETNLSVKNLLCKMHSKAKTCHFRNRVDNCKRDPSLSEFVDIEDLVSKSRKLTCCPYYIAREMQDNADVIFLPYNYLFDPHIKKNLNINLYNSIVILDEAHNINKVCEEAASVSLLSNDIALAITEVTQEMKALFEDNGSYDMDLEFGQEDLCAIKEVLLKLEKTIDNIEYQGKSATHIGSYIFKILKNADIDDNSSDLIISTINKLADAFATIETGTGRKGAALRKVADFLAVVFSISRTDISISDKFFKVHVESAAVTKAAPSHSWNTPEVQSNKNAKKVNFWCFNPGVGMNGILNSGVYSLILTSGTLSPLVETIRELNIGNPISLESPHIITPDQVLVNIVGRGPTGTELRSSYNNRVNEQYWNEIGLCLQNYTRVIPDGVLVFFPSYGALNTAIDHWKLSGLWAKLSSIKSIFVEPTVKHEFNEMIAEYNRTISEGNGRGALLLGVCRGKVSEGVDFINEYGRAVFIFGLPYPPLLDPKVQLKKTYLDQNGKLTGMNGDLWYQLEAIRAVNQAIGRVIRHSKDFGAILLCDVKFEQKSVLQKLSKWLVPMTCIKPFGSSVANLKKFFTTNKVNAQKVHLPDSQTVDYSMPTSSKQPLMCQPSTSKQTSPIVIDVDEAEDSDDEEKVLKKKCPKETVSALQLMADDDKSMESPSDSNKKSSSEFSFFSQINANPDVQPAKKRRIKIKPVKFDDITTGTNEMSATIDKRINDAKNFLCDMKATLDEESYRMFSQVMRCYQTDYDFDKMMNKLTVLFPLTDPHFRSAFVDCKKLLSGPHLKKFVEYCDKFNLNHS